MLVINRSKRSEYLCHTTPFDATAGSAEITRHETAESVGVTKSKMKTFFTTDEVTKAVCLWAMKAVVSYFSYNSAGDLKQLWMSMFPDSSIAKNLSTGSTKIAYVVTHGLAPYFEQSLIRQIQTCSEFVICFDEALNQIVQREQMDLVVR